MIPQDDRNATGRLVLGYEQNDSENLDYEYPLATGFPLEAGSMNVIVPDVQPGNNYIVVLFGDSGNASPEFTIVESESSLQVL